MFRRIVAFVPGKLVKLRGGSIFLTIGVAVTPAFLVARCLPFRCSASLQTVVSTYFRRGTVDCTENQYPDESGEKCPKNDLF